MRAYEPGEPEREIREPPRIAHDDLVETEDDPRHEHEETEFAKGLADEQIGGEIAAPRVEGGGRESAKARCREPARAEIRAERHSENADDHQTLVGGDDSQPALHQQDGRVQKEIGIE